MLTVRAVFGSVLATLMYWAFFFLPTWAITGSLDWPRGRMLIGVIALLYVFWVPYFLWIDPELLRERTEIRAESSQDKFATGLIVISILAWIICVPIDVHAWQLLPSPPPVVSVWGGLVLLMFGAVILTWTFTVNSFAATTVKIQEERGQTVIDTGPYAVVRHPMYAGMIPFLGGMALFAESVALAIATLPMIGIGFLPRILIEEKTLERDLPGYADYMKRVRSRIIPGVF